MLGNTLSLTVNRDRFGTSLYGDFSPAIGCGNGVVVRIEADSAETIHPTRDTLAGGKGISRQRIQQRFLPCKHRTDGRFLATDLVGQILLTLLPEQLVQLFHGIHLGNRNTSIAAIVTHQTFHKSLFIARSRIAEYRFKTVVGGQRGITGLFPGMGTESILDSNLAIVKNHSSGNTAEVLEYLNQGIQKALLVLPAVGQHHGRTTEAKPGAEQVDYCFDAAEIDSGFAPVDLQGISYRKRQWYKSFLGLPSEFSHQQSDSRLSSGEAVFGHQTVVDALGSVVLLYGIMGILVQTLPDKGYYILSQHRGFPAVVLALPGYAVAVPVFLDCVTGDTQHCGNLPLVHAIQTHLADLFVNFHCNNHLCSPPT